jgi:hypothetical protein
MQFGKAGLQDEITNNKNNEEKSFSFGGNDDHYPGDDHGVMQQRQ